jgi:hypothetical protein
MQKKIHQLPSSTAQGITKDPAAGTTSCASENFQTILQMGSYNANMD